MLLALVIFLVIACLGNMVGVIIVSNSNESPGMIVASIAYKVTMFVFGIVLMVLYLVKS
jgi:hypothetical protein